MLTGNPKKPLLFVKDPLLTQDMLLDDENLRMSFKIWEMGMLELFLDEAEHITEETFSSIFAQQHFLEKECTVCEDAVLALSATMSDILEVNDAPRAHDHAAQRRVIPLDTLHKEESFAISRTMSGTVIENDQQDHRDTKPGSTKKMKKRLRSVSAPPGANADLTTAMTGGRWPFPAMSAEDAALLAWRLMKNDRSSKFFGQWRGSDWIMPKFEGQRILGGDVHRTEMEFWFRLFAMGRPDTEIPDPISETGQGMPRMTFADLEDFLQTAGLGRSFKRSDVAEMFHAVALQPKAVFEREVSRLGVLSALAGTLIVHGATEFHEVIEADVSVW